MNEGVDMSSEREQVTDQAPSLEENAAALIEAAGAARQAILDQVSRKIVGQEEVIELALISLFSRGHSIFVGAPGLAKTRLVQSLAESLGLQFGRIQFTPDLMPSDITGTDILQEDPESRQRSFRFLKGPVFTQVLLADELNRTPPKTQAALLQAMQEGQVTAAGETRQLPEPFLVFATQNPVEQEGTYPLPEAQLDRFMLMIKVGYPSADEEAQIVAETTGGESREIEAVLDEEKILELQALARRLPVADEVIRYAVSLARATRPADPSAPEIVKEMVRWGAGPRASQFLVIAAKARALLQGRLAASREDVRAIAPAVLSHRVLTSFRAEAEGLSSEDIVNTLLTQLPRE